MSGITCPISTCGFQIALLKSRGHNSRGVSVLHIGLVDLMKILVLQLGWPGVNSLLVAMKHNYKFDGQFFHLYPKYALRECTIH